MSRLAVLGVGAMGARVAVRLASAGHDLVVWNRTASVAQDLAAEHGWSVASTPEDAATDAEAVIAMVRDDEASDAVWFGTEGAASGLAPGVLALDMSTLSVAAANSVVSGLEGTGAAAVMAPVLGSRPQADAGALVVLLGGDPAARERASTLLDGVVGAVRHVGGPGEAAALKLIVNAALATQALMMAELRALARVNLADPDGALALVQEGPVFSAAARAILAKMQQAQFDPTFPIELVAKDVGYAEGMTGEDNRFALLPAVARAYTAAATRDGAADIAAIGRHRDG